jgi:hypothetical protein
MERAFLLPPTRFLRSLRKKEIQAFSMYQDYDSTGSAYGTPAGK